MVANDVDDCKTWKTHGGMYEHATCKYGGKTLEK